MIRLLESARLAQLAARAADERKASDTVVLDLRERSPLADFFVVTSGTSTPHLRAIAEHVEQALDAAGARTPRREGGDGARWILLDYGDVVVHIFHHAEREFYSLESLWDGSPPRTAP